MFIKVRPNTEWVVYFDIKGEDGVNNKDLHEDKRFGAKLYLPSIIKTDESFDNVEVNGEIVREFNYEKYIKLHVKELVNPPVIGISKQASRHLSVEDIFTYPELKTVLGEITTKVSEIRELSTVKK